LFESARLPHGRQDPLDGESYDNLFMHFRLTSKNHNNMQHFGNLIKKLFFIVHF